MSNNTGSSIYYHSSLSQNVISTEVRFLIICCKTDPTEEEITFIGEFIRHATSNREYLITLASRHGILPLVYKTLKDLSQNDPRFIQNATFDMQYLLFDLKPLYLSIAQRNIFMSAELIRTVKLFKEHNIPALPFKGPILSQAVYEDITLRQFSDIDILIRKKDLKKASMLLKERDYTEAIELTESQQTVWSNYAYDMELIHPQKGTYIELHWDFFAKDHPLQLSPDLFWEETILVDINGHELPTFSTENLFFYLCIHGSKHLWERIEWVKDLDLIIRKHTIDWIALIQRAEETGFSKMVHLGLSLTALLFHTPLPKTIEQELDRYPELHTLVQFIVENWEREPGSFARMNAILKLFPTCKAKLMFLHKIILKPSLNEYRHIELPKSMHWFYYFIRPYLLLKKYAGKGVT